MFDLFSIDRYSKIHIPEFYSILFRLLQIKNLSPYRRNDIDMYNILAENLPTRNYNNNNYGNAYIKVKYHIADNIIMRYGKTNNNNLSACN